MKRFFTPIVMLFALVGFAFAADISGTWNFDVQLDAGSGAPTFTFQQEGEKITGTYKGQLGEAPLSGTVKGNAVQFTFKVSQGGESLTAKFDGTIESATSMKGKADYSGLASGTWTAKKAK